MARLVTWIEMWVPVRSHSALTYELIAFLFAFSFLYFLQVPLSPQGIKCTMVSSYAAFNPHTNPENYNKP